MRNWIGDNISYLIWKNIYFFFIILKEYNIIDYILKLSYLDKSLRNIVGK